MQEQLKMGSIIYTENTEDKIITKYLFSTTQDINGHEGESYLVDLDYFFVFPLGYIENDNYYKFIKDFLKAASENVIQVISIPKTIQIIIGNQGGQQNGISRVCL